MNALHTTIQTTAPRKICSTTCGTICNTICSRARKTRRAVSALAFGPLAAAFMLLTACSAGSAASGCAGYSLISALGECNAAEQNFGKTASKVADTATSQIFPVRRNHTTVVFENKLWVIGGLQARNSTVQYSDVWFSADGKNWTEKTSDGKFPSRAGHASVVFKGRMWIFGGDTGLGKGQNPNTATQNDIWSSSDGQNWTQTATTTVFSERSIHSAVVFDNKMWVIGGTAVNSQGRGVPSSDVWSSPDGATWTLVSSGKFPARQGHGSAVFDGKIWVVGGGEAVSTNLFNDVWSSSDGVNWTEESAAAAFAPRDGLGLVTFGRSLWVVGGSGGRSGPTFDDIWVRSGDGTWIQSPATIPQRSAHTLTPLNQKLFIIGGADTNATYGDVWVFE